jgi:hypothetical protein
VTTSMRMATPVAMIAACVVLLIGCLPLPIVTPAEPRPEEKVADASSKRPLRLQMSTAQDARAVLGEPSFTTQGGRTLVYEYRVYEVLVVGPLCAIPDRPAPRYLLLTFDEHNALQRFIVTKEVDED